VERRVLIAIFLSFLVLYAYQAFFAPKTPPPKPGAAGQKGAPAASTARAGGPTPAAAPAQSASTELSAPTAAALVGDQSERDARLETPHIVAVFTNRGARLKSWRLKDYLDSNGQPLELVETSLGNAQPLPFSLQVSDSALASTLNSALYAVHQTDTQLTFEYRNDAGVSATKSFTMSPSSYTIELRALVSQGEHVLTPTVLWGPGLGDSDSQTGRYAVKPEAIFSSGGSVSRLAANRIASQPAYDQEFEYVGVDDHYFAALAVKPGRLKVSYQAVQVPAPAGSQDPPRDLMAFSVEAPRADQAITFYVGPKDFDTLAAIDPTMTKAINFGMFSVLVVPLLRALEWIHAHVVSNYGWAIVILTLVINLILFPLNHKSVVSMRKMQEVQPEAKAIQERYKNLKATDPAKQKMNQELMALYKEHGVNPASGCLPMILILPVFLAFYALLQTAIELRGAPFFGWIHDLSLPDAYYVLPILVGASQIVTQLMTPQPGADPAQQKMMMIMPLVLIFVFVSTPAGALIYWLVGNVWRVGQMQISNYLHPPKVRVVRPAAERRVKRVGGGKTDAARES
jgi:YidC/Oxa1 family membrane protein insertase